jgi:hypothetical protein
MNEKKDLSIDIKSFDDLIKDDWVYVDKTTYLADMIADGHKTWFLARPQRFGKSLIVSTLRAIFSGKKELFQGLAIEKRLEHENFSPRPVIHLDMSLVASYPRVEEYKDTSDGLTTSQAVEIIKKSLGEITIREAKNHGIDLPSSLSPHELLRKLIEECSSKHDKKVAILIDNYDSPVRNLLDDPIKADEVRESLKNYYMALKDLGIYISFVFVTGVIKFRQNWLHVAFNNPRDISLEPKYGALTGFTHEELEAYFEPFFGLVKNVQKNGQIMDRKALLEKIKEYYNGFCFDGKTMVYNPYSIVLFFQIKNFVNFWFNTATYDEFQYFMLKKRFIVDPTRKISVSRDRIENPDQNIFNDPEVYLYQLGYLRLRPCQSQEDYVLDCPNAEVRQAMDRYLLQSYSFSEKTVSDIGERVKEALLFGDIIALIDEINRLLDTISSNISVKASRDEYFYWEELFSLFYSIGIEPKLQKHELQKHEQLGRVDFVLKCGDKTWIIHIKISYDEEKDLALAEEAILQMPELGNMTTDKNTVWLSLVINDQAVAITAWACPGQKPKRVKTKKRG